MMVVAVFKVRSRLWRHLVTTLYAGITVLEQRSKVKSGWRQGRWIYSANQKNRACIYRAVLMLTSGSGASSAALARNPHFRDGISAEAATAAIRERLQRRVSDFFSSNQTLADWGAFAEKSAGKPPSAGAARQRGGAFPRGNESGEEEEEEEEEALSLQTEESAHHLLIG